MKDWQIGDDGDIVIGQNGLLFTDTPEEQLIKRLMFANKGTLKAAPLVGAGVRSLRNARAGQDQIKNIIMQLEADGWVNETVTFDGKQLWVFAERNN